MMSVSDSPIWSFQKSVMIGIGNSVNWSVWSDDEQARVRRHAARGGRSRRACSGEAPSDLLTTLSRRRRAMSSAA